MSRARFAAALAPLILVAWTGHAAPGDAASAGARPLVALRVAALAERMLKLQAQAGQGVLAERSRRGLAQAAQQLDANVRALGVPAAPLELHESAAILALIAAEYQAWALKPPTRDHARQLGERAEEVAWEARKVARLLGASSGAADPPAWKAAEGCALAQRIARLLLWQRWGIGAPGAANELALAEAGLHLDLEALRAARAGTPEIEAELQLAENQAAFLFAAAKRLEAGSEGAHQLEFVAKASDNVYESMERLAALYARLAP